jgi:hypothetical protein
MNSQSVSGSRTPTRPGLKPIETAILHTVAYVDVFDFPLTLPEIHRYLMAIPATLEQVEAALSNGRLAPDRLTCCGDFFTLPGRENIVQARQEKAERARQMWPLAVYYGRLLARLPFARMVAVTGSLAVDNVGPDADIDYLVVTGNGRLWLCRALVILVVRRAARRGVSLCPNYFITERALYFSERNLYNARELAQMRPVAGLDVYRRLRQINQWTADYLPNATGMPPALDSRTAVTRAWRQAQTITELPLRTPLGTMIEQWEMQRKIRRFNHQAQNNPDGYEIAFTADACKGHFDSHGRRVMEQFNRRLQHLEEFAVGDTYDE